MPRVKVAVQIVSGDYKGKHTLEVHPFNGFEIETQNADG